MIEDLNEEETIFKLRRILELDEVRGKVLDLIIELIKLESIKDADSYYLSFLKDGFPQAHQALKHHLLEEDSSL